MNTQRKMQSSPTTNTKRIAKELSSLKYPYLVNDHSIEIFYNDKTTYIFSELLQYPFVVPAIQIENYDLIGKKWVFEFKEVKRTINAYGQVSLGEWCPSTHFINIIDLIEEGIINKELDV